MTNTRTIDSRCVPTPRPRVSIILPAYNEAGGLAEVAARVARSVGDITHEIIIVDDGSRDATWDVIGRLAATIPHCYGIRLARNFGHQAALRAGLEAAQGDAVIMLDSDGQHPPECIPQMISAWQAGAAVVQMVRAGGTEPLAQRLTSRAFYQVFSDLSGVPLTPACADFRLMNRETLDIALASNGSLNFLRGLIAWLGVPTIFIPYAVHARIAGRAAYSMRRRFGLALDGLLSFSTVPMRVAAYAGGLIGTLSLGFLAYVVMTYMRAPHVVTGWASTAGLVALVGGMQLLCLGVIGEYVARIYTAGLKRPAYIVLTTTAVARPTAATRLGAPLRVDSAAIHEQTNQTGTPSCEVTMP